MPPTAPPGGSSRPLGELGWRGKFQPDSPEVVTLRERLLHEGGIKGLPLVSAREPGFAAAAAELFHRDGYVMLADALDPARQATIEAGCDRVIREMVALDPQRLGNRGSHRYAYGTAPSFFGAAAEFSVLVDPPAVLEAVEAIFESPLFTCSGYGGDFVLPGCVEMQHLHRDIADYLFDPTGRLDYRDMPCAVLVANYPTIVGAAGGETSQTTYNGPTRQISGTQHSHAEIPALEDEPLWMKLATTAPAPAGCCLLRDIRAWHGVCTAGLRTWSSPLPAAHSRSNSYRTVL
jgi:hypothetical protein